MKNEQKHDLVTHTIIFGIIAIGLLIFDFIDNGAILWSLWPVGGWLIGLAIHGIFVWRS